MCGVLGDFFFWCIQYSLFTKSIYRCLQVDTAGLPEMLAGGEAGNWLWSYLPDVLMSVSRGGDEVRRRCGEGSAPGNMS